MDKNEIKMNILWPIETQWQTCKFTKRIFEVNLVLFRFLKEKAYF